MSENEVHEEATGDEPRRISKVVGGLQDEAGKVVRAFLERNPVNQETVERIVELVFKLLNRREVILKLLGSMKDMQSEITEAIGFASQADVADLKAQLAEINHKMDKLQRTLDEIVVEVDEADE